MTSILGKRRHHEAFYENDDCEPITLNNVKKSLSSINERLKILENELQQIAKENNFIYTIPRRK